MQKVQAIIEECGRGSQRLRDLPAAVVVFYVLALNLFPGVAYQGVLGWLLCGLQWLGNGEFRVSGKGALSAARTRLGAEPMRRIHQQMAIPLVNPDLKGSFWKGMHLVALDGSSLALQDTASNEKEFGRSSNQNGPAAYPQARFVVLAEVGTHLVFAAELDRYEASEIKLAEKLIGRLGSGMLCFADRLFPGYWLWKRAAATGAHLLWRAKTGLNFEKIRSLPDGSWLARWYPSNQNKKQEESVVVRVIEYRLKKSRAKSSSAEEKVIYRLITTLLEPNIAEAIELAQLYPQRWEVELAIREAKTILRHGQITLRSKTAELVRQEFWGLLLAHYLVRRMMAQAALKENLDPDQISYQSSIEIIKSTQAGAVLSFSP